MRGIRCLLVALGIASLGQVSYASEESGLISACSQTVMDYAFHRDRPDADKVAALFTPDAQLSLLGDVFAGRAAIRERVAAGMAGPVFRHMISTVQIVADADGRGGRGVSYVTVYRGTAGALPQSAPKAPMAIGEYHDRFVMTPEGCQIAERKFVPVFLSENS